MAPTTSLSAAHTLALAPGRRSTRHPVARASVVAFTVIGSTAAFCLGSWAGIGWLIAHHVV